MVKHRGTKSFNDCFLEILLQIMRTTIIHICDYEERNNNKSHKTQERGTSVIEDGYLCDQEDR